MHDGAFACVVKEGTILAIPPGTICISYSGDSGVPPRFIKWSRLDSAMYEKCLSTIKLLLDTHEHLQESDYKTMYDRILMTSETGHMAKKD